MSYLDQRHAKERARDEELAARGLPELAFMTNTNPAESQLIGLRRGESGYWKVNSKLTADELNAQHGVTPAQRHAMYNGSLFGWDTPGADPAHPLVLQSVAAEIAAGAGVPKDS